MRRSDMAASMEHHEPPMRDIDLDEDARIHRARELEERERERYHHLPVHHLEKEKELREVVLPPTPSAHRHVTNGAEHREHAVDVKQHTQGQPATLTVTEQHIVHQQTTHPEPTKTKSKKRVGFGAFPGFGRKGGHVTDAGEGREVHHTETVYEKNGASSAHAYGGQGHLEAYDSPTTLTVYAGYLKRVPGLLRIVQLVSYRRDLSLVASLNLPQVFSLWASLSARQSTPSAASATASQRSFAPRPAAPFGTEFSEVKVTSYSWPSFSFWATSLLSSIISAHDRNLLLRLVHCSAISSDLV